MILLDAKALMYHSYFIGTDPEAFESKLGNMISTAEYGFNQFMNRYAIPIFEAHAPIDILVCHDAGTDYRTKLYPEYKQTASRTERDPEQKAQQVLMFDMMKRFFASMGCTQAKVPGVEADDLIAYCCQQFKTPINIYTVDVDLLKLQGDYPNVSVLLKCEYQESDTYKGVPLNMVSLHKSMVGDTSDNYKGVKGFGPAKWDDLVEAYGYDGIEELEACVKANDYTVIKEVLEDEENQALRLLYDNREDWRLGYSLACLRPELCWKPSGNKLVNIQWFKRLPNGIEVNKIFRAMGCADLITHEAIEKWLPVMWGLENADVDEELFEEFEKECANSPIVAFDYETYPSENAMPFTPKGERYVDVKEALIAGVSFTFGENLNQTFYMPVNHKDTDNVRVEVVGKLLKIAERASKLVAQNSFFEIAVTKQNLDFWLGPVIDTQLMQSYVDENELAGLKGCSLRLLGYTQASYAETVADPVTGEERTMDQLTLDEVLEYGCDDAIVTAHLWVLHDIVMQLEGSKEFFMEYELQSVHGLVDAYLTGAEVDWDALEVQRAKDEEAVAVNDKRLRELLLENCSTVSQERAKSLVEAETEYLWKKAKKELMDKWDDVGGPPDDAEEMAEEIRLAKSETLKKFAMQCLEASAYVPPETTFEDVEFLPTASQFQKFTTSLGFDTPLEKVTRAAITEWLAEATNLDMETKHDIREKLTVHQSIFVGLLAAAAPQLNKRAGDEYEKLIYFCQKHSKEGKEITVGDELNTGSPKQMQQILYCKLGLPVRLTNMPLKGSLRSRLKVDGSPQTDALAMQTAMAEDTIEGDWRREAIECLLAIKGAKTRNSLYHVPYALWRHPTDNRLHPQIKNCGTVTRRPSSRDPNILQVSKHQEDGVMRSIFIPLQEAV